ncbi:hypothetical protein HID58_046820 [Brassica napus]|uniref:Uncharacterized protein n=1 Tax=Brassica napus TaxID=3708 RepID=A0ABQ8AXK8_BRANA|nr:hypothetical protein HID58_046820 [Brassica napus]
MKILMVDSPGLVLLPSFSFIEESSSPLYLLYMTEDVLSPFLLSDHFSLSTILLSCVSVYTGPGDANESTCLSDFVVKTPLTHLSFGSNL